MSENLPHIQIYTDGGADPNPGPGGWGVVLVHPRKKRELSGGEAETTNNRMELTAAIEALKALRQPCQIDFYTDSQYLCKGASEWVHVWSENGWYDVNGDPVINEDLWRQLYELQKAHLITWHWVRGHAGNFYNERAHQLAAAAIPRPEEAPDPNATRIYLRIAGPERKGQGACGWAAAILRGDEMSHISGGHPNMSINGFSLYAVLQVLAFFDPDEKLQIFTNNAYLYNGITKWVDDWRSLGWASPEKFNAEWQALDRENQTRQIKWFMMKNEMPEEFRALETLVKEARAAQS